MALRETVSGGLKNMKKILLEAGGKRTLLHRGKKKKM